MFTLLWLERVLFWFLPFIKGKTEGLFTVSVGVVEKVADFLDFKLFDSIHGCYITKWLLLEILPFIGCWGSVQHMLWTLWILGKLSVVDLAGLGQTAFITRWKVQMSSLIFKCQMLIRSINHSHIHEKMAQLQEQVRIQFLSPWARH